MRDLLAVATRFPSGLHLAVRRESYDRALRAHACLGTLGVQDVIINKKSVTQQDIFFWSGV